MTGPGTRPHREQSSGTLAELAGRLGLSFLAAAFFVLGGAAAFLDGVLPSLGGLLAQPGGVLW